MNWVNITAVISQDALEAVEDRLRIIGVPNISVSSVKGYGAYTNLLSNTWVEVRARIEVFAEADQADYIVEAIRQTVYGREGADSIIAVMPVGRVIRTVEGGGSDGLHRFDLSDSSPVGVRMAGNRTRCMAVACK